MGNVCAKHLHIMAEANEVIQLAGYEINALLSSTGYVSDFDGSGLVPVAPAPGRGQTYKSTVYFIQVNN